MIDKLLNNSSYQEKNHEKNLADMIVRTIETSYTAPCAHHPLQQMLDRYSSRALYPVFSPAIQGWLKYLLSHPQTIYYYWKRHRLKNELL